jgi:hypothetical protein
VSRDLPDPDARWWTPLALRAAETGEHATVVLAQPTLDHPALDHPVGDQPTVMPAPSPVAVTPEPEPASSPVRTTPADGTPPRPRHRRPLWWVAGALAVLVFPLGWSVGTALARPTSDSTSAKLAEWGRDHHLGWAVTWLEQVQYDANPPKKGGQLAGGIRVGDARAPAAPTAVPARRFTAHTATPAAIPAIVQPGLAGEGVWRTLATGRSGLPAILGTAIRPDTIHTSYQVGVAWMDPRLVRFELHPGLQDPGGSWRFATSLGAPALQRGLVAAFNAGFRLPGNSSRGGWYLDGRTVYPLRDGAASFVIYKDGRATVGAWNRDVRMSSGVLAVRQNLDPLVSGGVVDPTVDESNTAKWGYTLGAAKYVPRTGVGVTGTGAIVYAAGLTNTRTLAEVLRRAGCVRAMELDINYEWAVYDYFTHEGGLLTPHKLTPDQQQPATHFLSASSRDFFAVYAR